MRAWQMKASYKQPKAHRIHKDKQDDFEASLKFANDAISAPLRACVCSRMFGCVCVRVCLVTMWTKHISTTGFQLSTSQVAASTQGEQNL